LGRERRNAARSHQQRRERHAGGNAERSRHGSNREATVRLRSPALDRRLPVLAATTVFWLVAGSVLLYRLGGFPLKDFDEAIYVAVAREMLRTGDYLTLHFNNGLFFDKPPLYFWTSALFIRVLGFSEFTSRLPGVLFGALTLWAIARWGRELGGIGCGLVS